MPSMSPDRSSGRPALTVVIPALNEEEAIGATLDRCMEVSDRITEEAGLDGIQFIVVSDGSTDRTARIARQYEAVTVYEFERNRGYGAAIKFGFSRGTGDLLGFIDADGTCDPTFFTDLCREVIESGADIALGSRLTPDSRMPGIRTLGNRLFALLLSSIANRPVTDTASGMRVLRRSVLEALGPLPDGLHFTPAMSARAVLRGLRVTEVPMTYVERVGTSKLRVSTDGVRFLRAILDGLLLFRPERVFWILSVPLFLVAAVVSIFPVEFYLSNGRVEEWMIYRFLLAFLVGGAAFLSLGAGTLVAFMAELVLGSERRTFVGQVLFRLFRGGWAAALVGLLVTLSLWLVWPGIAEYVTTGRVSLHWSRVIVAAFGLLAAFQVFLTALLMRVAGLWIEFGRELASGGEEASSR